MHSLKSAVFPGVLLCVFAVSSVLLADTALADRPRLIFDSPRIVEGNELPEAVAPPGERLIELKIPISTYLAAGNPHDLVEVMHRVEFADPANATRIVDWSPRTALFSEIAGNVAIEKSEERNRQLGLTLNSSAIEIVKGGATASLGRKSTTVTRYQKVPQHEVLAASGVLQRGTAAYFRFKPSPQTTFEGSRELCLTLAIPASRRAGALILVCEANGVERGFVRSLDEPVRCGAAKFLIPFYAADPRVADAGARDAAARDAADRLAQAESELRTAFAAFARRAEGGAVSSGGAAATRPASGIEAISRRLGPGNESEPQGGLDSPLDSRWLEAFLFRRQFPSKQIAAKLPKSVREGMDRYALAWEEIALLEAESP